MGDGVVSNEVIKRRLPPWMLGVVGADKERAGVSNNSNSNLVDTDDRCGGREDEKRVKKRGCRRPKSGVAQTKRDDFSDGSELEKVEEESSAALMVSSAERKRTKRKLNLDVEVAPKEKKKQRKGKARETIQIKSSKDAVTGGCLEDDEDGDLTVEDLMIFAKECVQEDNGAQEVESVKEHTSPENQIEYILQSGNSIDLEENKKSSEEQEVGSSVATTGNVNVTSEGSDFKPSMSGDPTQDMLDLFLGPLLKKTQEKEKKVDLTTEEMDFNFGMKGQNMSSALGEGQANVTVAKKKSSLRDRVAMFLN